MTEYDKQYKNIIKNIIQNGHEQFNERTGHKSKCLFGQQMQFDLSDGFPILTLRKIPLRIFVAEQIWFIAGCKRPDDFLQDYTNIWNDFVESDGTIGAAYGYRWRHHFGRDQLDQLVKHLEKEPHSRQALVSMWDPADDGLYGEGLKGTYKKNAPCPFFFVVNIINNRLCFHLMVRSNDMVLGNPHDVAGHALLAYILAARLKVDPGDFVISITNAHIHDINYTAAEELLKRDNDHKQIKFAAKANYYQRAENKDHALVKEIIDQIDSQYFPNKKKVKGLKIVL